MAKQQVWKATTKARGNCSPRCRKAIFTGYGRTSREAKNASEAKCYAAGCHTPGESLYACDCGHSTIYAVPNWKA